MAINNLIFIWESTPNQFQRVILLINSSTDLTNLPINGSGNAGSSAPSVTVAGKRYDVATTLNNITNLKLGLANNSASSNNQTGVDLGTGSGNGLDFERATGTPDLFSPLTVGSTGSLTLNTRHVFSSTTVDTSQLNTLFGTSSGPDKVGPGVLMMFSTTNTLTTTTFDTPANYIPLNNAMDQWVTSGGIRWVDFTTTISTLSASPSSVTAGSTFTVNWVVTSPNSPNTTHNATINFNSVTTPLTNKPNAASSQMLTAPAIPGSYTLTLTVNDPVSIQRSATRSITITVTTGVATSADLAVTLTPSNTSLPQGATHTLIINATNNGPNNLSDASISLPLPAGVTLASQTGGTGTYTPPTWSIGSLNASSSTSKTLTLRYTTVGAKTLTATIASATVSDANKNNNSDTKTITVRPSTLTIGNFTPTRVCTDSTYTLSFRVTGSDAYTSDIRYSISGFGYNVANASGQINTIITSPPITAPGVASDLVYTISTFLSDLSAVSDAKSFPITVSTILAPNQIITAFAQVGHAYPFTLAPIPSGIGVASVSFASSALRTITPTGGLSYTYTFNSDVANIFQDAFTYTVVSSDGCSDTGVLQAQVFPLAKQTYTTALKTTLIGSLLQFNLNLLPSIIPFATLSTGLGVFSDLCAFIQSRLPTATQAILDIISNSDFIPDTAAAIVADPSLVTLTCTGDDIFITGSNFLLTVDTTNFTGSTATILYSDSANNISKPFTLSDLIVSLTSYDFPTVSFSPDAACAGTPFTWMATVTGSNLYTNNFNYTLTNNFGLNQTGSGVVPTTISVAQIKNVSDMVYTFTISLSDTNDASDTFTHTVVAGDSFYPPQVTNLYSLIKCGCSGDMALILRSDLSGYLCSDTLGIVDTTGSLSPYSTIFGTVIPVVEKVSGLQSSIWTKIRIKWSDNTLHDYQPLNVDEEIQLITSNYQLICCADKLFLGISGNLSDHITHIPGSSDDVIVFILPSDFVCGNVCSDGISKIVCGSDAANYQNLTKIMLLSE